MQVFWTSCLHKMPESCPIEIKYPKDKITYKFTCENCERDKG